MNESNDNLSMGNFISELDKKRRRERSVRFKIGDVMNDISEMSELPDKQIEVQNRITELNELKEQCTCLNNEIIDLLPDDQVEIECQSLTLYYKEIRNISDKGQRYVAERTAAALSDSGSGHRPSLSESTSKTNSGIKLPKLDLPCFTGDVLKFMTYWDQLKCAMHENQELSEVQKFTHLRSTLKGSALHAIEGFEVTVAIYEHAVAVIPTDLVEKE